MGETTLTPQGAARAEAIAITDRIRATTQPQCQPGHVWLDELEVERALAAVIETRNAAQAEATRQTGLRRDAEQHDSMQSTARLRLLDVVALARSHWNAPVDPNNVVKTVEELLNELQFLRGVIEQVRGAVQTNRFER